MSIVKLAPIFHPIRSEIKTNRDSRAFFSRAFRRLHVISSSFDWFTGLSVSLVIGWRDYFGFGLMSPDGRPL